MKKKWLAFCFLAVLLHTVPFAQAAETWVFDNKITYDIYLYSYPDHSSIIKDVKIERFEHIGDVTFLIIRSTGFRLKDSAGFVRLDAVAAILPNKESFLQDGQKIEIRY